MVINIITTNLAPNGHILAFFLHTLGRILFPQNLTGPTIKPLNWALISHSNMPLLLLLLLLLLVLMLVLPPLLLLPRTWDV